MENIKEIIESFREKGITFSIDSKNATQLKLKGQRSVIEENLEETRKFKSKILDYLTRDLHLELSSGERLIWNYCKTYKKNVDYNIAVGFKTHRIWDQIKLKNTILKLAKNHTILTQGIKECDGIPRRVKLDVSHLKMFFQHECIDEKAIEEAVCAPFDLEKESGIRLHYFQNKYLLFVCHHIAMDFHSLEKILLEFLDLYEDEEGKVSDFQDFVRLEKQDEEDSKAQEYWDKKLIKSFDNRGLFGFLKTDGIGFDEFSLSEKANHNILSLAKTYETTPYSLLLFCFHILLARLSSNSESLVFTPFLNRRFLESKEMIGSLINTIPNFFSFEKEKKISEIFKFFDSELRADLRYSHYPLSSITKGKDLCFDFLFSYHSFESKKLKKLEEGFGVLDVFRQAGTPASFLLTVNDFGRYKNIQINYKSKIGRFASMQMKNSFINLLESLESVFEQKFSNINLISKRQQKWLKDYGNGSKDNFVYNFSKKAKILAEKQCVVSGEKSYSYLELDKKSDSVAFYLRKKGLKIGDPVLVSLSRTPDMIAVLLGIWKAGAYYIPIDPRYPETMVLDVCKNSNPFLAIVSDLKSVHSLAIEKNHIPVVLSSELFNNEGQVERIDLLDLPAYAIYTSGSTGKAKGVLVSHKSVFNLLKWGLNEYSEKELREVLASTPLCFDVSVFEIFLPLLSGSKIHLVDDILALTGKSKNFKNLSLISAVPSAMKALTVANAIPENVCTVNLAGEVLHSSLVQELLCMPNITSVVNLYGPTEGTVYSTFKRMKQGFSGEVNIGKPIHGVEISVRDHYQHLSLPGTPGELVLSGDGLALGYIGNISSGFSSIEDKKYYATGDIVRFDENGDLHYIGRKDTQVKVRGFRIELEAIENVLLKYKYINGAVSLVLGEGESAYVAVAVAVNDKYENSTQNDLKSILRENFPEYMVPQKIFLVKKFPYLPSGKIDRTQLLNQIKEDEIELFEQNLEEDLVFEKALNILKETLNVKDLSFDRDFFDLGGNSILAVLIAEKLSKECGVFCTSKIVMQSSNIKDLFNKIGLIDSQSISWRLSPEQEIIWADAQHKSPYLYNIAFAEETSDDVDVEVLEKEIQEALDKSLFSQLRIKIINGKPNNFLSKKGALLIEKIRLSGAKDLVEKTEKLAKVPFDLENELLIRIYLLESEKTKRLVFVTHHIVFDAVSYELLKSLLRKVKNKNDITVYPNEKLKSASTSYWESYLPSHLKCPFEAESQSCKNEKDFFSSCNIDLSPQAFESLQKISKKGISRFSLFVGAMDILIKFMGIRNSFFGSVFSGRCTDSHNYLGNLVRVLPVVCYDSTDGIVSDFFKKCYETLLDHIENQWVNPCLISNLIKERMSSVSSSGIFQAVISYQNITSTDVTEIGGASFKNRNLNNITTKFPLTFTIRENEKTSIELAIDTRFFPHHDAQIILNYYVKILGAIENNWDKSIRDFSWSEPQKVLEEYKKLNLLSLDNMKYPSILERFSSIVQKYPDSISMSIGSKRISYKELDSQSSKIANWLISFGYSELKVAFHLSSRWDSIILILAITKARGTYIPISMQMSDFACKRNLSICNPQIVIGDNDSFFFIKNSQQEHNDFDFQYFKFSDVHRRSEVYSESNQNTIDPDILYIMFSSGSTGAPKGIKIPPTGIVPLVCDTNYTEITNKSVLLQHSDLAFDASTFEIWGALLNGARLELAEPGPLSLSSLEKTLSRAGVSILWISKSYFDLLMKDAPKDLFNVKQVISGGEVLDVNTINKFINMYPNSTFNSAYGLTEATTFSIVSPIKSKIESRRVPLGHPIRGEDILILGEDGKPLPVGCYGEIAVGSLGLMLGYLGSSSNDNIIPIEIEKGIVKDFYRSGDYGRILQSGKLDFLGRKDQLVKIKGFRVNFDYVAEIITSASRDIHSAHVFLHTAVSSNEKILAAVVCIENKEDLSLIREKIDRKIEKLEKFQRPKRIVLRTTLKLTKNGKLNLDAMLEDELSTVEMEEASTHKSVCGIKNQNFYLELSRILGHDVDPQKSFFENNGDSLNAIELLSTIDSSYRIDLSDLLSSKPLSEIVRTDDENETISKDKKKFGLTDSQSAILFSCYQYPNEGSFDVPISVSFDKKNLPDLGLRHVVESLFSRQKALSLYLKEGGEGKFYLFEEGGDIDLSQVEKNSFEEKLLKPLDFEKKLSRIIFYEDRSNVVLGFNFHHLIFDLWSVQILINDLKTILFNRPMPTGVAHYGDYLISKENFHTDNSSYWSKYLSKKYMPLNWNNSGSRKTSNCKSYTINLKEKKSNSLFKKNAFWLSVFQTVLFRFVKQNEFIVGVPFLDRKDKKYSQTIGCFVQTLPVVFSSFENLSFEDLVEKNSQTLIAHMENPYSESFLRKYINFKENSGHLYNVLFVGGKENYFDPSSEGLGVKVFSRERAISDLMFSVSFGEVISIQILFSDCFNDSQSQEFLNILKGFLEEKKVDSFYFFENKEEKSKNRNQLIIQEVFEKVLNKSVDFNQSFFDLGGTSLQLVKVHKLLQEAGYELTINELLVNPVVSSLTRIVTVKNEKSLKKIFLIIPDELNESQKNCMSLRLSKSVELKTICTSDFLEKYERIEDIAEEIFKNNLFFDKEICLVGWSYTGLVAQHLAALLEEKGLDSKLVLLDTFNICKEVLDDTVMNETERKMKAFIPRSFSGSCLLLKAGRRLGEVPNWQRKENNGWDDNTLKNLKVQTVEDMHHYNFLQEANIDKTFQYVFDFLVGENG